MKTVLAPARINYAKLTRTIKRIDNGSFKYCPKKYKWFSDFLWYLLNGLKAIQPYLDKVELFNYDIYHEKKIGELVLAHIDNLHLYFESPKDYSILIGEKTFIEDVLVDEKLINSGAFQMVYTTLGYTGKLYNIEVMVVPNMEGVIMVSKIFIEEKKDK